MVVGILGILLILVPIIGLVLGVIAVVLGVVSVTRPRASGRGMAISGIVMGSIVTLVGLLLAVFVVIGVAAGGDAGGSAETEPSPVPVEPSEPSEPSDPADVSDGGADAASFVTSSRNDLDDFAKDLDDMIVTLDEGGFWRLLSNAVELSFNYGQLSARTAPPSIAGEWDAQLAVLDEQITQISDAIADERDDDVRAAIGEAQAQVDVLRGILDSLG